jgi:hypothetical protein
VTDSATLTGTNASTATGSVTYSVYSDAGCTTAVSTGTAQTITKPGTLPNSSAVSLAKAGTYYWQASYSGDSKNMASKSKCGSEVETVTSGAPTNITTLLSTPGGGNCGGGDSRVKTRSRHLDECGHCGGGDSHVKTRSAHLDECGHGGGQSGASLSVSAGTPVMDSATISGTKAASAGGTLTYRVFSDHACTASAGSGGTVSVTAGRVPASSAVTLSTPGTYYWQASYSGDANNAPSKSNCGAETETVTGADAD